MQIFAIIPQPLGILDSPTFASVNVTDEDNALQIDGTTILRTGTAANNNVFLGSSVFANDDGNFNVGIGFEAGKNNDTTGGNGEPFGKQNVYIGYRSGEGATGATNNTGFNNVGLGRQTLQFNTTGRRCMAIGDLALRNNTTGENNMAVGAQCLFNNLDGDNCVAIGVSALFSNVSGKNIVAIGGSALNKVTAGQNVAVGHQSGFSSTSATRNIFIGHQSGRYNETGDDNIIIGTFAGGFAAGAVNSFNRNTFIGSYCGNSITTGNDNIFLGYKSGFNQTTNSDLLIIDNQDRGSAAAELTNCMIYGVYHATVTSQTLRFNVGNLSLVSGTPYQYLINNTHEDTDGGRESRFDFKGEQSGGELTTLARIEVGHDGAANDEKGKVVISTNDGDDGDTPTDQLEIQSTGDWVINKTSGVGIKVDLSAPTFGFADLLGDQFSRNTGASKPTLATYNGAVKAWQFSDGDEAYLSYHIPHDYVPGTDLHLHVHWSQNNAGATGGTIDFKYFAIYAKGHNQVSGSVFTSTPITATFSSIDINDGDSGLNQYQQHITEVTISAATATAALFDRDDFEPDGVIELTFEMDATNLTGTPSDPFIHYVDIHYQTTGLIGTKQKAPDFYT